MCCSCTTWPASDWMLFWAVSMTASRSCSLREVLVRRLGLLGDRMAEPRGHAVEPLADRAAFSSACRAAEHFGDRAHAPLHLRPARARSRPAGHRLRARAQRSASAAPRLALAAALRSASIDQEREQRQRRAARHDGSAMPERERGGAELDERAARRASRNGFMRATLDDSRRRIRPKRERPHAKPLTCAATAAIT